MYSDRRFILSCDLNLEVKVHVSCAFVESLAKSKAAVSHAAGLSLTLVLVGGGVAMHSIARRTQLPEIVSDGIYWNEWVTLPVKYNQLPKTAQLIVRLWTPDQVCVGGTTVRLFDERLQLKRGKQRLTLWPSTNASKAHKPSPLPLQIPDLPSFYLRDERLRMARLRRQLGRRVASESPWMHGLTSHRLAQMLSSQSRLGARCTCSDGAAEDAEEAEEAAAAAVAAAAGRSGGGGGGGGVGGGGHGAGRIPRPPAFDSLIIEFPMFPHPVVYDEEPYPSAPFAPALSAKVAGAATSLGPAIAAAAATPKSPAAAGGAGAAAAATGVHLVHDPEMGAENPVSVKYHKLARDVLRGLVDPDLKPNKAERERIAALIHEPSNSMPSRDADLLWKFRHSLTGNKKALTKFLMCVDWDVESESKQALDLLHRWAPIDMEDALRLLSPEYTNRSVRKFAVDMLARASDEELSYYLLQLVSALRFENWGEGDGTAASARGDDDSAVGGGGGAGMRLSPLARLLVRRAARSHELATFLHWFLTVETQDSAMHGKMFSFVYDQFVNELERTPGGTELSLMLSEQAMLVGKIQAAAKEATSNRRLNINTKVKKLNELLSDRGNFSSLLHLVQPVVLPVNPKITVTGVVPGQCKVFKSAMYPVMMRFYYKDTDEEAASGADERKGDEPTTTTASSPAPSPSSGRDASTLTAAPSPERKIYSVMVKIGDDIRQDQLMLQLIRLFDFQLKRVNVDLKLSPYPVLATSPTTGMVQIVPDSHDVSEVIDNGGVLSFFRKHHPDPDAEYGVKAEVMDTYVRSCAGYSVITYLLGIGDRHLENIMLKTDGHLFHIDFGFIFGRDPKPYPPPMKLTREMVEGMGGPRSENYNAFKRHACDAYNELRKSANLVLNLLRLMQGCSIEDLRTDAETTILKVEQKFRLDISREDAEIVFLKLVDDSVSALFPVLFDTLHKVRVMLR